MKKNVCPEYPYQVAEREIERKKTCSFTLLSVKQYFWQKQIMAPRAMINAMMAINAEKNGWLSPKIIGLLITKYGTRKKGPTSLKASHEVFMYFVFAI